MQVKTAWGITTVMLCCLAASPAYSQKKPEFKFGDPAEVKDTKAVEWHAAAQAGLLLIRGNSISSTFTGGAKASRKAGNNKLQLDLTGAYQRSDIVIGVVAGEPQRQTQVSAQAWRALVRYDRFLSEHNSLYLSLISSADEPAGKELVGGGQFGYSRLLFKTGNHSLVSEVGYDFSYEDLTSSDGVSIHSGRVFAGYEGKLSADTGVNGSVEVLANVNTISIGTREAGPFDDTRVIASTGLTTKLLANISFQFGFAVKYDHFPADLTFAMDTYRAEKTDYKTDASLIINFL